MAIKFEILPFCIVIYDAICSQRRKPKTFILATTVGQIIGLTVDISLYYAECMSGSSPCVSMVSVIKMRIANTSMMKTESVKAFGSNEC